MVEIKVWITATNSKVSILSYSDSGRTNLIDQLTFDATNNSMTGILRLIPVSGTAYVTYDVNGGTAAALWWQWYGYYD